MKICDLTQFYSPLSGGVKRYLHEKIAFIKTQRPEDSHVLIVPGASDEMTSDGCSRIYSISSPLVSRATKYRALLDLRAIGEIIEREKPDIIESSDPYQLGWKAIGVGAAQRIPAVAFYHSHFVEAYLRGPARRLGKRNCERLMKIAQSYVRNLYNRFAVTFVPSAGLAGVLREWGVTNAREVGLGVDVGIFRPGDDRATTRGRLGLPTDRTVLLYVGRLAPEKNTTCLFEAFALLAKRSEKFHLLVIGDGQERGLLQSLAKNTGRVTWIPYCADSAELAQYYRAADLFVHPGVEETFGLVAIESQACGTPVVGIRGSFMDQAILHEQRHWARENNPASLANAVEAMASQDLTAFGFAAAARAAERFAWPRVFDRLFSIYREVCAGYRRA